MYYTYMLRCQDNSIYTGITTDIEHRMKEHFEKSNCAKYTYPTEFRIWATKILNSYKHS